MELKDYQSRLKAKRYYIVSQGLFYENGLGSFTETAYFTSEKEAKKRFNDYLNKIEYNTPKGSYIKTIIELVTKRTIGGHDYFNGETILQKITRGGTIWVK